MTAYIREIADDIRTLIVGGNIINPNTGLPIQSSDVTVLYLPRFDPDEGDLNSLRILIAPRTRSTAWASRSSRRREIAMQVAAMQLVDGPESNLFTGLLDMVESIETRLAMANTLTGVTYRGQWVESQCNLYDVAALEQHSVFRSILTITYSVTT